ncbi:MAG: hypothetical protein ACFFBD_07805 [Candidatus Hodarchaeota archaeon]
MEHTKKKVSFFDRQPSNESSSSKHRSEYWYLGSYFDGNFDSQYQRLALLHKHANRATILSYRGIKLREIVSVLSEWFPLPLLDAIVPKLLTEEKIVSEELLCRFLGLLELELRQKGLCIRLLILDEINRAFNTSISKKDIFKWFWVYRRIYDVSVENIDVVKKLTAEEIIKSQDSIQNKKDALKMLPNISAAIKRKKIIFQDPEIYGYAVARICLKQIGKRYGNDDPRLRKATSKAVFRLRNELRLKY